MIAGTMEADSKGDCMINIMAIFENGVLRPTEPLDLSEGERVQLTVSTSPAPEPHEAWERQIRSAKTIQEWIALANTPPAL